MCRLRHGIHDRIGNVFRLQCVARTFIEERRVYHAWLNQGNADTGATKLLTNTISNGGNRPFGRTVHGTGDGGTACRRAGKQQVALALPECWHAVLKREPDTVDIGEDHVLPDLRISATESARLTAPAGIGEHRINTAKGFQSLVDHVLLIITALDVTLHRQHRVLATQFLLQAFELVFGTGRQHQTITFFRRCSRCLCTNTRRRAGDQHYRLVCHKIRLLLLVICG